MLPDLFEVLRDHFTTHGYWTLAITLLLENAGIPLPGETMLLFASFLASQHHQLNLGLIILVATAACTVGDNLGYWIGYHGGRPLLHRYQKFFRISDEKIAHGEEMFERFGPATVFVARFVFGMRIIAGPLAGVLRMQWRRFVLFNFLGAAALGHGDFLRWLLLWTALAGSSSTCRARQRGCFCRWLLSSLWFAWKRYRDRGR